MPSPSKPATRHVSALRVFGAIGYDLIALCAIWYFATLIVVIFLKGEAVESGNYFYTVYLLLTAFAYFGWCWTRTGQTLGMKSWKIAVVTSDSGQTLDWNHATRRFAAAIVSWGVFGMGFLWAAVDPDRRFWHDRLSRSHLTQV